MRETLIELVEGIWIDPWEIKVVKSISDSKSAFWVTGQSAMDGFVLDYPADEVVQAIEDAREKADEMTEDDEIEDQ